MKKNRRQKERNFINNSGILPLDGAFLDGLQALSPGKALERVLNHPDCSRLIQTMSSEDFFFLIQKIGIDESLALLKRATLDQWQYVLDVESWQGDRLELKRTGQWMDRLLRADPDRFTKWLFSDGQGLAYYFLYRCISVEVMDVDEEMRDLGPDFFTVDDFFFVRPLRENQREIIENLIRSMAREDSRKYQALLTGLAGVLPAELEEDMYRMRNVRLAEHGFLPREEAIAVYAPLDPDHLKTGKADAGEGLTVDPEGAGSVPRWPLQKIGGRNLLTRTIVNISDQVLLDRIRLEFAGLCNQMLSAEGLAAWDVDSLEAIQVRAAGYLNLVLKERCQADEGGDKDVKIAEDLLRLNPIVSLFRAGFGLAVHLKWKAQRWLRGSWFQEADLESSFWGETWGGVLSGLLKRRPLYYRGEESQSSYRDFRSLSELSDAGEALGFMAALDRLMGELTKRHSLRLKDFGSFPITLPQLLFTLWARELLDLEPGFNPLPMKSAKAFLRLLREGDAGPPYRMFGFEERFLKAFEPPGFRSSRELDKNLQGALAHVWRDFSDEMEFVFLDALEAKYSKFIQVIPD